MNTERTVKEGDAISLVKQLDEHWAIRNPLIYYPMKAYFDEKMDEYAEKHDDCHKPYGVCIGDAVTVTTFREFMWAHFLLYFLPTYETHSPDEIKTVIDSFFEYYGVALAARDESSAKNVLMSDLNEAKSEAILKLICHYIVLGLILVVSCFFSLHNQIGILIGGLIGIILSIHHDKLFNLFKEKPAD